MRDTETLVEPEVYCRRPGGCGARRPSHGVVQGPACGESAGPACLAEDPFFFLISMKCTPLLLRQETIPASLVEAQGESIFRRERARRGERIYSSRSR